MEHVKEFLNKYTKDAKVIGGTYGIPWLVILAQAALESAWGKKAPGNNFFGIKDSALFEYGVQTIDTTEHVNGGAVKIKDEFETFPDAKTCFEAYAKLMRARFPLALKRVDPVDFITSLQTEHTFKDGRPKKYATDTDYVQKISNMIRFIKKYLDPSFVPADPIVLSEDITMSREVETIENKSPFKMKFAQLNTEDEKLAESKKEKEEKKQNEKLFKR